MKCKNVGIFQKEIKNMKSIIFFTNHNFFFAVVLIAYTIQRPYATPAASLGRNSVTYTSRKRWLTLTRSSYAGSTPDGTIITPAVLPA